MSVFPREIILRSSELATLAAIFHFRLLHLSGSPPLWDKAWLSRGAEESPCLSALPATNNCVSTSEDAGDSAHYAPPWNYNPEDGRGPVSREAAMAELLEVVKSTNANGFTPRIAEKKDDYLRVEYESPIMGFVDDVEFWFPPGEKPLVNYRSASRLGILDFDVNRKRIKALRQSLEKKGWASESGF
ncbi:unnamed protein product [Spirodela intermedia]|uniref:Uncharacterized protein n=1 Tax=Spirodela intermedia TaxID=51605 RepID=A0A7I8J9S6_SPIIN|nr:unnamed protein product [Spirodela intermedia]CAA6666854.1 unnamed protein product [Spirodela intermedia]